MSAHGHARVLAIDGGITPSTGPKDVTAYDGFDRVTRVTAADGTFTTVSYEPRQTTETNALGIVTTRTLDSAGSLIAIERNPGGADATQHSFVRDGRGEIVSVTDGDGHVRRIERDGGGRLRHVTLPTAPGETPTRFSMCHDVQDKLVHLESPAGRVVDITYDELDRPLVSTGTDVTGLTVQTSQTYDKKPNGTAAAFGLGRLTSKSDESGVYALTYDNYGRPATLSLAPSVRAKAGAPNVAASYGATYAYTPAGALKSVVFSGVPTATATGLVYTRDVKGRATSIDARSGTTAAPVTTGLAASVTYDAADRVTSARYGNDTKGEWTFNALTERLDRIAYKTSSNAVLAAVSHIYDANDNLLEERREKQGTAGIFSQKVHTYDALDRLRTSDTFTPAGNTAESYVFSPSGNLLSAGDDAYGYARRPLRVSMKGA